MENENIKANEIKVAQLETVIANILETLKDIKIEMKAINVGFQNLYELAKSLELKKAGRDELRILQDKIDERAKVVELEKLTGKIELLEKSQSRTAGIAVGLSIAVSAISFYLSYFRR